MPPVTKLRARSSPQLTHAASTGQLGQVCRPQNAWQLNTRMIMCGSRPTREHHGHGCSSHRRYSNAQQLAEASSRAQCRGPVM